MSSSSSTFNAMNFIRSFNDNNPTNRPSSTTIIRDALLRLSFVNASMASASDRVVVAWSQSPAICATVVLDH